MNEIVSQKNKELFTFDGGKTKALTNLFAEHNSIVKIFIEPHFKERLNLNSNKIRFHGCSAVRHDGHIHIQLK
jgi:murein endopeptidase